MSKILVACEESQAVTIELRKLGHEAYSCDLLESSGGYPEYHLQGDVTEVLRDSWDAVIAFPPCTYLTVTGNRWFNIERYGEKAIQRHKDREDAIKFFSMFTELTCPWAIENPVGYMNTHYRKPDQIIQPWQFGDEASKTTCLWLHKLPKLTHTDIVKPGEVVEFKSGKKMQKWYADAWHLSPAERAKLRSKTFPGIAKAMALQWSNSL